MVWEGEQKGEGNGKVMGRMVWDKEQKGEGNGEVHGENSKGRRAESGGKWEGAQGEW